MYVAHPHTPPRTRPITTPIRETYVPQRRRGLFGGLFGARLAARSIRPRPTVPPMAPHRARTPMAPHRALVHLWHRTGCVHLRSGSILIDARRRARLSLTRHRIAREIDKSGGSLTRISIGSWSERGNCPLRIHGPSHFTSRFTARSTFKTPLHAADRRLGTF